MLLIAGGVVALAGVAGLVFVWGLETLSLVLLRVLAEGDDDLVLATEEGEGPLLPTLKLIQGAGRLSLPARVGLGWTLWLVDWLEGRRAGVRRWLWGLAQGGAILFVRTGAAMDMVLCRRAQERGRRRLGRKLLYEMVVAHRGA